MYFKPLDADDWCVNCGRLVMSYKGKCPWCGKPWDVKVKDDDNDKLKNDRRQDIRHDVG